MHDLQEQLTKVADAAAPVTTDEVVRRVRGRRRATAAAVAVACVPLVVLVLLIADERSAPEQVVAGEPLLSSTAPDPSFVDEMTTSATTDLVPDPLAPVVAVIDGTNITMEVTQDELGELWLDVGPPETAEHGWFTHEVRVRNDTQESIRLRPSSTAKALGDEWAILVAGPNCGYAIVGEGDNRSVMPGACRLPGLPLIPLEPGATYNETWTVTRDLPGFAHGGLGTHVFEHEITFEYPGDLAPHVATVLVTYVIEPDQDMRG